MSTFYRFISRTGVYYLLTLSLSGNALGADATSTEGAIRQYTFAWPYLPDGEMAPRGGSTQGEKVQLDESAGQAWLALREPGLPAKERDRRAILAMAGPYRASFDFIETVGFNEGYRPGPPYQSWGTEFVYVVADEPNFISLQHIMVLRVSHADGEPAEPVVVKHWRQDWHYQSRDMHVFVGHREWVRRTLSRGESRGKWLQSVYQVDDSPRYAALGSWEHSTNFSSWTSNETWRPLPRREFSVRDDYEVLIGTNRHTITPTGWVQEEHNLKTALDETGSITQVLARENGLARYERIVDFDWRPGDDYWQRTGPFWAVVREIWRDYAANNKQFKVAKIANGMPLVFAMFGLADTLTGSTFDASTARVEIEKTIAPYVTP